MASNFDHILMCLFVFYAFSLVKYLFTPLPIFQLGCGASGIPVSAEV
jgi:hypothetical protein